MEHVQLDHAAPSASELRHTVQLLLEYLAIEDACQPADLILGLGSDSAAVAKHAARLYHQSSAPLILFSGGIGRLTGQLDCPEAVFLKQTAVNCGVPENAVLTEEKSTNTLENILFSRNLLSTLDIQPLSAIVVTQPVLHRRGCATAKRQWPEVKFISSPPPWREELAKMDMASLSELCAMATGEIDRLVKYAAKGDIEPQEIPGEVWDAYKTAITRQPV